jgi:flagellar biosynthesis chaperone FliJ
MFTTRQIRKMVLWHGVVNLQDFIRVQHGELSDLTVSLEKTFQKMQEAKRTLQDKVKREKALHLVWLQHRSSDTAEEVDQSTG